MGATKYPTIAGQPLKVRNYLRLEILQKARKLPLRSILSNIYAPLSTSRYNCLVQSGVNLENCLVSSPNQNNNNKIPSSLKC